MSSNELQVVEACDSDKTESHVLQNQNGRSRGEPELQKKLNKLRSIKLAKSPARRRSKRRSNNATADDPQNSGRVLIRRSSFKPVNSLTRMSSVKFKNPLVRKSSGGTQLNKYRSSSPNFLKETCCSSEKRIHIQGSPHCSSESSCNSTPNSARKSARLSRTKSKTRVIRKQSEIPEFPDLGVQRATCSSALKHCKSPPEVKDVHAEGSESEGASATKPCPFTYCSLHGHRHATVPPLKSLISLRRRLLKTQKGTKQATQSPVREKKLGKIKEDGMCHMVSNGHDEVHGTTSLVVQKLGREELLQDHDETCSKEHEDNYDLSNVSEKLFHETLEGNLQETSDLATVEQHALVSPPSHTDLCPESCCIGTASEVTNTDLKEENCAASCINDSGDFTSTDKMNSSSPISIPVNVESDDCTTVKLPYEVVESTSDSENHEKNCASGREAPEEQTKAFEQNYGSLVTDKKGSVELDKKESAGCSMQAKNNKYITMWKLMYKHAVKGNAAAVGNPLPLHGEDKEGQAEYTTGVLETNNPFFPETGEHTASTNDSAVDQILELYQKNAIDLVQEAFDKILLPEVQDSSYDDQSVTSDINSDQEGFQLRNDGGESRTFNSGDYTEDRMVQNAEETQLETENSDAPKEKAVADKFEQNTPKRWSSLKKFILLKKFVKAIEKVRNFSYQKPHHLPLDPDPEAEKINLRQLAIEDKKSADEWMLDYALQKVISKLPSAQQRRVALLVEAFETVLPFPDIRTQQRSNAIDSSEADIQACNGSSIQTADEIGKESNSGTTAKILVGRMSSPEQNSSKCTDKFVAVNMDQPASPVKSFILKESSAEDWSTKTEVDIPASGATDGDQQGRNVSMKAGDGEDRVFTIEDVTEFPIVSLSESKGPQETSLKQGEDGSTGYEVLENETVQEISTEHLSISSFDLGYINSDVQISNGEMGKLNTNSNGAESDLSEDMVVSLAPTILTARAGSNGGGSFLGSPPPEDSPSESNADVTHVTQLEKQNYTRLWYFVYKHMVSSIAEKDGDEPPEGADEEQGNDTIKLPQAEMDPKLSLKNQHADHKKNKLHRIETVKLVEKAIDEILLPESQDELEDDQADTTSFIPHQEPPESKVGIEGKSFATFSNFAKGSLRESKSKAGEDPEQILLKSDNAVIQDEEKEVLMVEEKPKQKMSKNWRNLKKMILLNRFIKALEKGKKSDSRGPNYLLLEPDPETEKVYLKHQNMDERKNAEEWMLDYALQKAVAKLTPARSRKVALLVEAFETVIPNNGIPNPFRPEVIRKVQQT